MPNMSDKEIIEELVSRTGTMTSSGVETHVIVVPDELYCEMLLACRKMPKVIEDAVNREAKSRR